MSDPIKAVIDKLRAGEEERAFFELIEMPGDVIPQLIDIFRIESSATVRAFFVKVAWERREKSVIPFLGEALHDSAEEVWQVALDGLVMLASSEASETLQAAKSRQFADEADHKRFHRWLEEAIQQVEFELRR